MVIKFSLERAATKIDFRKVLQNIKKNEKNPAAFLADWQKISPYLVLEDDDSLEGNQIERLSVDFDTWVKDNDLVSDLDVDFFEVSELFFLDKKLELSPEEMNIFQIHYLGRNKKETFENVLEENQQAIDNVVAFISREAQEVYKNTIKLSGNGLDVRDVSREFPREKDAWEHLSNNEYFAMRQKAEEFDPAYIFMFLTKGRNAPQNKNPQVRASIDPFIDYFLQKENLGSLSAFQASQLLNSLTYYLGADDKRLDVLKDSLLSFYLNQREINPTTLNTIIPSLYFFGWHKTTLGKSFLAKHERGFKDAHKSELEDQGESNASERIFQRIVNGCFKEKGLQVISMENEAYNSGLFFDLKVVARSERNGVQEYFFELDSEAFHYVEKKATMRTLRKRKLSEVANIPICPILLPNQDRGARVPKDEQYALLTSQVYKNIDTKNYEKTRKRAA